MAETQLLCVDASFQSSLLGHYNSSFASITLCLCYYLTPPPSVSITLGLLATESYTSHGVSGLEFYLGPDAALVIKFLS